MHYIIYISINYSKTEERLETYQVSSIHLMDIMDKNHFPMQKSLNITSSNSSTSTRPVTFPNSNMDRRISSAAASIGKRIYNIVSINLNTKKRNCIKHKSNPTIINK